MPISVYIGYIGLANLITLQQMLACWVVNRGKHGHWNPPNHCGSFLCHSCNLDCSLFFLSFSLSVGELKRAMFPGTFPHTAHPPTGTPDSSSTLYKTCQDPLCARLGRVCGQSRAAFSRCHYCRGNCCSCQRLQLGGIAFHKDASGLVDAKRISRDFWMAILYCLSFCFLCKICWDNLSSSFTMDMGHFLVL